MLRFFFVVAVVGVARAGASCSLASIYTNRHASQGFDKESVKEADPIAIMAQRNTKAKCEKCHEKKAIVSTIGFENTTLNYVS